MTKQYIITVAALDPTAEASSSVIYQQTIENLNLAAVIAAVNVEKPAFTVPRRRTRSDKGQHRQREEIASE